MKKNRFLFVAMLFAALSLGFVSCDDKKGNEPDNPIQEEQTEQSGSTENNGGGSASDLGEDEGDSSDAPVSNFTPAAFSVSADKKVYFSPANLQYHPLNDEWRFAENQTDVVGNGNTNISTTYDGWIDLFGWGTGNEPTRTIQNNGSYSTFVDWGTNSIGTDAANTWRTMSADELRYILSSRLNAAALNGIAHINGVNGLVLLPDDWVAIEGLTFNSGAYGHWSREYYAVHNTFTLEQWQQMEEAGAIFLPTYGFRQGNSIYGSGSKGYYWTTSPNGGCGPMNLEFSAEYIKINSAYRYSGLSVRLVKDIQQ